MAPLIVGSTVLCVCIAAWGLGGKADWPWPWIYLLSTIGIGAALGNVCKNRQYPVAHYCGPGLMFLLWLGFALWLAISFFNCAYMPLVLPSGVEMFYPIAHRHWLPSTVDGHRTLVHGIRLLCGLGLAWALWVSGASRRELRFGLWVLYLNAIALALVGTYYNLNGYKSILGEWKSVNATFFATFRYHNHWGGFCLLMLGVGAALCSHYLLRFKKLSHRKNPAIFILGSLPFMALTIPLTGGRGSMIAGSVLALIWMHHLSTRLIAKGTEGRFARLGMIVCALIIIGGILWVALPVLNPRWSDTLSEWNTRFAQGSVSARMEASRITFTMFLDRPACGWGLGSFAHVFPRFAKDFMPGDSWLMEFAHNDWLQYLAELGLVGLGLLGIPVLAVTGWLAKAKGLASASAWLLGGLASVLLLACMDFPLSNPAVELTFFILLGYAWRYTAAETSASSAGY